MQQILNDVHVLQVKIWAHHLHLPATLLPTTTRWETVTYHLNLHPDMKVLIIGFLIY